MKALKSIVLVVGQLGNGGLERQLAFLLPELQNKGVIVRCVVWNYEEDDIYTKPIRKLLGKNLVGLPSKKGSISKILALRKLLREFRPDLVLSFSTFINMPVYVSALGICNSIGSLRTSAKLYAKVGGVKAKLNLRYPQEILANSKKAILELNQIYPGQKAAYLKNAIDVQKFRRLNSSNSKHEGTSISVGNVRNVKRLDRMLLLFDALKKQGHQARHIHIGGGQDLNALKAKATEMGLDDIITFAGPQANVAEILSNHNLFLHFAEYEGSPNVIMEAMAAGLAIITTDCGDVKTYIKERINGYVIHPFSLDEYAARYVELIETPELREAMVRNSLEMISKSDISFVGSFFLEGINALGYKYHYPL
ncbi:glycosyltransferase [Owenweeksia hongkongensis DSM 17368]|uniref:Glycosyltransferase n=1 Tax=Owenweeksia hongkongensis (strain DSM 17368 / CIP 108786 / JCM 12287 / NRRL B-23963 / UST20020801) TaxID=926562 RepID=G8R4U9_OWEHD|nr:glycosyltransferase [Owenweeksia hongkongensis]AEV34263.1 glycosyltransferase [Owenweeksia hongkongensis DSM 17368]